MYDLWKMIKIWWISDHKAFHNFKTSFLSVNVIFLQENVSIHWKRFNQDNDLQVCKIDSLPLKGINVIKSNRYQIVTLHLLKW